MVDMDTLCEARSITMPLPLYRTLQRVIAARLLPAHNQAVIDAEDQAADDP
jgi:hypothetical protein